jgi:hypothetical protein
VLLGVGPLVSSPLRSAPGSETRMNVQNARWLLVTIFVLVVAAGCSPVDGGAGTCRYGGFGVDRALP